MYSSVNCALLDLLLAVKALAVVVERINRISFAKAERKDLRDALLNAILHTFFLKIQDQVHRSEQDIHGIIRSDAPDPEPQSYDRKSEG